MTAILIFSSLSMSVTLFLLIGRHLRMLRIFMLICLIPLIPIASIVVVSSGVLISNTFDGSDLFNEVAKICFYGWAPLALAVTLVSIKRRINQGLGVEQVFE